ncbi:hypothetical protein CBR_g41158 [Chara braunii]|uniref:Uncharacterized protein n=1 Tax=Chara braunii TaxID=69332 RepID=A0A388K2I6_CHABU|nr:hypothetical protein CBR_g41158 [Chara braunii]|eukprot:GBG64237.1 hypothetical protein CBR_g41158 [Chara braunii]
MAVKRGRHQPSRGSAARDDEWVRDFEGAGDDDDFVSETEVEAFRQASLHARGAVRINEPRPQSAPQPRGGEGVRKADVFIDVDAGQAAMEVQLDASPRTARAGGPVATTRVTAPPDAQDFERGGAMAGSSRPTMVAAASKSRGEGDDDEPLVNRQRRGNAWDGIEAATKLWVDDMRFRNETKGNGLFKVIQEAQLYFLAIARGVTTPEICRSIALPHSSIPQYKIEDELQLKAAKNRATKVQSIALRVIHGWIFKSTSLSRGYHSAYGYFLHHEAMDMARVVWLGEDWCTYVSPSIFHITLEMDMKLPVWFVGAHIEDRYEDDELACYQEATVLRLVSAFTSAVSLVEGVDGGCISYATLRNIADVTRLFLAASMGLMRMSRDDLCFHFNASLFVQLIAKPTLVAAMHRCFDARRPILRATTVMTERMGKPP